MKLKLQLITVTVFILACGFIAGYSWPHRQVERITEDDPRWDCRTMGNEICGEPDSEIHAAFVEGQRDVTAYVESCTVERAHAGQCSIPCSGEADCQVKNGSGDNY